MSDVQSLLATAQAGVISGAASAKSAFDAVDVCLILTLLNDAASDLVGLKAQVLSVDYETLHEGIVATTAAATTSMLVGIALLLLPVLLGRNWLDVALAILACFLGSVGTCLLLAREQVLFDSTTAALGIVGEAKCGLQITLIAAATIACGVFTTRLFALIMFATGTLGAGYVGFVGLELITPLVPADYQQLATSNTLTYAAVGFIGLLGGYVLATCGKPFINAVLGLLGATLTAQGGMKILLTDVISPETAAHMQADQYYTYYVASIALLLYVVRSFAVCCREGCASTETVPQPVANKKLTPAKRNGARVGPASSTKKPVQGRKSMV